MLKRILSAALAFAFVLSLSACSKKGGESENTSSATTNTNTNAKLSGTINVNMPLSPDNRMVLQLIADDYMAINKDVTVNINITQEGTDYVNWLSAQMSNTATSQADIVQNNVVSQYYQSDKFVDFTSYLNTENTYADGEIWKDVLEPAAYRSNGSKNEVFSLSSETTQVVWFYNKALFKQNNLTVPQTFDEFVSLCEKISNLKNSKGVNYKPLAFPLDNTSITDIGFGWLFRIYADQYFKDFLEPAHAQKDDYCYNPTVDANWSYQNSTAKDTSYASLLTAVNNDAPNVFTDNPLRVLSTYLNNNTFNHTSDRYKDMLSNFMRVFPKYTGDKTGGVSNSTALSSFVLEESMMYLSTLDFIQAYPKHAGITVAQAKEKLGMFFTPPMSDHNKDGVGAPAANYTRSLGGPATGLGIINKSQEQTNLVIDFMKYLYSPKAQNAKYEYMVMSGIPAVGSPLVKNVTIPESINYLGDELYRGECDLNPINEVSISLGGGGTNAGTTEAFRSSTQDLLYGRNGVTIDNWGTKIKKAFETEMTNYLKSKGYREDALNNMALSPFNN